MASKRATSTTGPADYHAQARALRHNFTDLQEERRAAIAAVVDGTGEQAVVDRLNDAIRQTQKALDDVTAMQKVVADLASTEAGHAHVRNFHAEIEKTRGAFTDAAGAAYRLDALFDEIPTLLACIRERLNDAKHVGRLMPESRGLELALQRFDRLNELARNRALEVTGEVVPPVVRGLRVGAHVKDWTEKFLALANHSAPVFEEDEDEGEDDVNANHSEERR